MIFPGLAGILAAAAAAEFSPADLGPVLSWMQGDNASNVKQGPGEKPYVSLFDRGTVGGTYTPLADQQTISVAVDGLDAAAFRGERTALHTAAASNFALLSNGTSSATLTMRVYLYEVKHNSVFFATNIQAAMIGISVKVATVSARLFVANGTANTIVATAPGLVVGWNTISIRKTTNNYEVSVSGASEVSGSQPSPSESDPQIAPYIGASQVGGNPIDGLIAEIVLHSVDIGVSGRDLMETYMVGRYSATPDLSTMQFNGTDTIQFIDPNLGVTSSGGLISKINDQSGYNNHVEEATNKPALVVADPLFSDKDTADFDGLNDFLRIAAFTGGTLTQPYVMACCGTWDFDNGSGPFIYGHSTSSRGIRHQSSKPTLNAGSAANMTADAPVSGTVFSIYGKFDGATSQGVFNVDGVTTKRDTLNPGTGSLPGSVIGATLAGSSNWDGKSAMSITLDGDPSDADRDLLVGIVNARAEIVPAWSSFALQMDGVDQYVTMGDVLAFEGTDAFTISAWVKDTGFGADLEVVVGKRQGTGNLRGYSFGVRSDGDVIFYIRSATGNNIVVLANVTSIIDGNWHLITCTYDGSQTAAGTEIYVDAVPLRDQIAADDLSTTILSSTPFLLGSLGATDRFFGGTMDEASVWSKELSQAEVTEQYNSGVPFDLNTHSAAANLVGYFPLGDGDSFPTIHDETGAGNDGTMTNMAADDIVNDSPT